MKKCCSVWAQILGLKDIRYVKCIEMITLNIVLAI